MESVLTASARALIAPLALKKLRQLRSEGLPEAFVPPLEFLFSKRLDAAGQAVRAKVESLREKLAMRDTIFDVAEPHTTDTSRTPAQIAFRSSVTAEWGTFLYLCARSFQAESILEMGSCAGISGSYLASSDPAEMITIEASPSLATVALFHLQQISEHVTVINARFDDAFDRLLPIRSEPFDFIYIDGHHQHEPTMAYLRRLIPHLRPGSLLVFDDIHWSKGMWDAWRELRDHEGFSHTLDVGRFGLCLWEGGSMKPKSYNLALYAGWRPGGRNLK